MSSRRTMGVLGPLVLDTGGVLAFIRGNRVVRELCEDTAEAELPVLLPTVVYAQVERGGTREHAARQNMRLLLDIADVATLPIVIARQAGWLLGDSQTRDVVDAVVVVEALNLGQATIITSDPGDMIHLLGFGANRTRRSIRVIRV